MIIKENGTKCQRRLEVCKHCEQISKWVDYLTSCEDGMTNREYWIMTEVFVYLHDGKDFCKIGEEK